MDGHPKNQNDPMDASSPDAPAPPPTAAAAAASTAGSAPPPPLEPPSATPNVSLAEAPAGLASQSPSSMAATLTASPPKPDVEMAPPEAMQPQAPQAPQQQPPSPPAAVSSTAAFPTTETAPTADANKKNAVISIAAIANAAVPPPAAVTAAAANANNKNKNKNTANAEYPSQQHQQQQQQQQQQRFHEMPPPPHPNAAAQQQQQQPPFHAVHAAAPPVPSAAPPQAQAPPPPAQDPQLPALQQPPPAVHPGMAALGAPPPHAAAPVNAPPQPPVADGGPMRGLRVEDALLYLDDVKHEFKGRPNVYNEFLGIMKNFKSQEVDTPGVIARVSKLFRGYNKLILGFNTFLPDGYKISPADLERQEAEFRAQEQAQAAAAQQQQQQQAQQPRPPAPYNAKQQQQPAPKLPFGAAAAAGRKGWTADGGNTNNNYNNNNNNAANSAAAAAAGSAAPAGKKKKARAAPAAAPAAAAGGGNNNNNNNNTNEAHQAVEFDHAISYVTTIKKRFVNDPGTYHQFLEILHTYQKEQRGIKEVLEQVAHLFQDHPDLLKEFTFFLPDAVQEQAKERLHRAAAESETRLAAQRQQQQQQQLLNSNRPNQAAANIPSANSSAQQQQQQQQQKFIDMTTRKRDAVAANATANGGPVESYVYNSAVERQFFDAAREAMSFSRDGGQAWAEFLKCLGLYADEVLSRTEMLQFVEPLLGKRNTKLLEEFKRILVYAGTPHAPVLEDAWYSVPLSEIDFSRCRRCSPSYRALPRDYPPPPCSDRNSLEAQILNDVWVSLPVGSEESYTFRHMRRNTYEETLFRVEDERFEIDMVIGSNAATLKRLEPIAEEIAGLAREEPTVPSNPSVAHADKEGPSVTGLAGKRFQVSFDKTVLSVIHKNAIRRLYGDHGNEMLELMVKNPTVTIPLVVDRLRQKNAEWIQVRTRLNRNWRALAEQNYFKSLDNRSLTWRTIDKRATSTRTLLSEIKDRAANGGMESPEALRQKLDKAKEEHGSFYEITKKDVLEQSLDLTCLPKPDRRLFAPHLSIWYEHNSWVQQDAYRILAFALERGPVSPADKEKCHRLWLEFLGPWFGLSPSWMQKPAVAFMEAAAQPTATVPPAAAAVVSEDDDDDDESMEDANANAGSRVVTEELKPPHADDDDDNNKNNKSERMVDYHPLPVGAPVTTLYGEGTILEYLPSTAASPMESRYVVRLAFGTAYVRPSVVLGSVLPVEKHSYTRELRTKDPTKLARPSDQLAIGTQSMYLFFRLHQILVRRLNIAKRLATTVASDRSLVTMVERMEQNDSAAAGRRRYDAYLSLVYALLEGGVGGAAEGGKYEDRVRCLLGHGAYELATMDKLISHIWKNLQSMAQDETTWSLIQLYRRHREAGSFRPEAFRQEAGYLLDGEQVYAFQYCPVQGKDESVLHTEYLGVIDEGSDAAAENETAEAAAPVAAPPPKRQKR